MTMLRHAAPALVHVAEAKLRGEQPDMQLCRDAVAGLLDQSDGGKLDTVVLGCTHFPLVADELAEAAQQLGHAHPIRFVDGSDGIARRISHLTEGQAWPNVVPTGIFLTTGPITDIEAYRPLLNGYDLANIQSL
jgi:glutamate racemase